MTSSPDPDRSELAKLYPTPKTYEEHRAERRAIDALKQARLPKHTALRTSVFLTLALGAILVAGRVLPNLFMSGGIAGICFGFLLLLFVVWCTRFIYMAITGMYDRVGVNHSPFFVAYFVIIAILTPIVVTLVGVANLLTLLGSAIALIAHAGLVWVLARLLTRA